MIERQRGALNLVWVAIFSGLLALAAMAALYSMRYERNLFAEGLSKVGAAAGGSGFHAVLDSAKNAVGAGGHAPHTGNGAMRKCVIDGKTVMSNTECLDTNPTSKNIAIHKTAGIEAPKKPVQEETAPTSTPAIDKMIEKQLR